MKFIVTLSSTFRRLKENDIIKLYELYEGKESISEQVYSICDYWINSITPSSWRLISIIPNEFATKSYPIASQNITIYDIIIDPFTNGNDYNYIILQRMNGYLDDLMALLTKNNEKIRTYLIDNLKKHLSEDEIESIKIMISDKLKLKFNDVVVKQKLKDIIETNDEFRNQYSNEFGFLIDMITPFL